MSECQFIGQYSVHFHVLFGCVVITAQPKVDKGLLQCLYQKRSLFVLVYMQCVSHGKLLLNYCRV